MNGCVRVAGLRPGAVKLTAEPLDPRRDACKAAGAVTAALDACAFDEAADGLYRFIWNVVLRLVRGARQAGAATATTRPPRPRPAPWPPGCWTRSCKLLHPVSPFLTEELWARPQTGAPRDGLLIAAAWPDLPGSLDRPRGRGRDRPGHRRRQRGPLGPRRTERAASARAADLLVRRRHAGPAPRARAPTPP